MKKIIISLFFFLTLMCMAARQCDGCQRVVDEMMFDGNSGKLCTDCAYREMELDSQKDTNFFEQHFGIIITIIFVAAVVIPFIQSKNDD